MKVTHCVFIIWAILSVFSVTVNSALLVDNLSLEPFQVIQRNGDSGSIELFGKNQEAAHTAIRVKIVFEGSPVAGHDWKIIGRTDREGRWKSVIHNIPVGGEYSVEIQAVNDADSVIVKQRIDGILVGDVWIAGGQSNAVGAGRLPGPAAIPQVHSISFFDQQQFESGRATQKYYHTFDPPGKIELAGRADWRRAQDPLGERFTGPWVFAAQKYYSETKIPVGILWYCNGGKTIRFFKHGEQSDFPLHKAIIERFGKNAGAFLWYQGENNSTNDTEQYVEQLAELIAKIREYTGNRNMKVFIAQLGGFIRDSFRHERPWVYGVIRNAQLKYVLSDPLAFLVPALPYPLYDDVHIRTSGHKCVGEAIGSIMSTRQPVSWLGPKLLKTSISRNNEVVLTFDREIILDGRRDKGYPYDITVDFHLVTAAGGQKYQAREVRGNGRKVFLSFPLAPQTGDKVWYGMLNIATGCLRDVSGGPFPATQEIIVHQ